MVGKTQIHPTTVNIEGFSEIPGRHRRALEVPSRSTAPPWGWPRCTRWLVVLVPLPEGKVLRIALGTRLSLALGEVLHTLIRELAIGLPGGHREIDISRAIRGHIGVISLHQGLDKLHHGGDISRGAGLQCRPGNVERISHSLELGFDPRGESPPLFA